MKHVMASKPAVLYALLVMGALLWYTGRPLLAAKVKATKKND